MGVKNNQTHSCKVCTRLAWPSSPAVGEYGAIQKTQLRRIRVIQGYRFSHAEQVSTQFFTNNRQVETTTVPPLSHSISSVNKISRSRCAHIQTEHTCNDVHAQACG